MVSRQFTNSGFHLKRTLWLGHYFDNNNFTQLDQLIDADSGCVQKKSKAAKKAFFYNENFYKIFENREEKTNCTKFLL